MKSEKFATAAVSLLVACKCGGKFFTFHFYLLLSALSKFFASAFTFSRIFFAWSKKSPNFAPAFRKNAQMAELVDALVSNTNGAIRAGSIPALGTKRGLL